MPQDTKDKIADFVADWMHDNCPSWSIDTLLTWPDRAKEMATWVLRRNGRFGRRDPEPEQIHDVLHAAMNARKRGDLKVDRH